MKMIKVKIGSLTSEEFFEFVKQVKLIVDRYDAATLKIKNESDAMVNSFADLQDALEKEKGNALTKLLNDLDALRDRYIRGFKKWLVAIEDHPNATWANNATKFLKLINNISKDIARETQFAETTMLNTVVELFTIDATNKADLAAMFGKDWITAIETTNIDFATNYSKRVSQNATSNTVLSFSDARKATKTLFLALVDIIKSRYNTAVSDKKDVTAYEALINELNTLFASTNTLVLTSVARKVVPTTETK